MFESRVSRRLLGEEFRSVEAAEERSLYAAEFGGVAHPLCGIIVAIELAGRLARQVALQ